MALYHRDIITVTDNGIDGRKFRGGQVWAVGADTLVIRLHLELAIIGERTVPRSLAPTAILGDAICAEVTGDNPDNFVVVALHGAPFVPGGNNDSVARLEFSSGAVPAECHGMAPRLHWASGMLNERSGRG